MSIIHQNVQSIGNSIDKLNDMLQDHPECKIMCVTEHWKSEIQLPKLAIRNFKLCSMFCREEGQHGGTAIYVKQNIKCKVRTKLNKLSVSGEFECAAVECQLGKISALVITIYRPPNGNMKLFLDKLENILFTTFNETGLIFILGDFNIEIIKENKSRTNFLSLMSSFNFQPKILENTRITSNTSSCIDNIFTNFEQIETLVFENFISDHTAQKAIFEAEYHNGDAQIYRRFFGNENKNEFLHCLNEQDWLNVYEVERNDVNGQWRAFMNDFINIFQQYFPLKLCSRTKVSKMFKDREIIDCKRELDLLLTLSRQHQHYKDQYKEKKKEYDKLLKESRTKQYANRVNSTDNKMKCMWSICNEIIGKTNQSSDIEIEGEPEVIANNFNEYLISVIPDLMKNVSSIPFNCNIVNNDKSIFLKPVTTSEICEIAMKIKNKHSSGFDEIPTSIVKISISVCKNIICYIMNNSFKYGIFPENLKVALIKPVFKKGDTEQMDNYRPISLLTGFSKLFEMAMCSRLINFLTSSNIFSKNQHGFLKGRSTQTAIFQFIQTVLNHLEDGNIAVGMFLDLSKAYDCLDRDLLIRKLEMYGIRGNAHRWISGYLTHRKQKVCIIKNGKSYKSKILSNDVGIAQGSVLGPILFIVFINDLNNIIQANQDIVNYADDTNLLLGGKSIDELINECRLFLNRVTQWFTENKLILNKNKTNIILFRTKASRVEKPANFNNDTDSDKIIFSESSRFLGVQINEYLDWAFHIKGLSKKLNAICYGIRVTGKYMNEKTLKILYFANFESCLKYGIIFWGRDSHIQNIFVIQKRLVRIIKKLGYNETCRSVFKNTGLLTVYAIYIYECLVFFFKNRNCFEVLVNHQHNTRTCSINYPIHRLTLTERSPNYMCLRLYNKLPEKLKRINSEKRFKREIKTMLLELEPYKLEDFLNM